MKTLEATIRITQLTKAQRAVILALAGAVEEIEEEGSNTEGPEMIEVDGFSSNDFHCLTLKALKRMHVINDYHYHSPFLSIEFQSKRIMDTAAKIKRGKEK